MRLKPPQRAWRIPKHRHRLASSTSAVRAASPLVEEGETHVLLSPTHKKSEG